jgi:SnoaL-like domain
LPEPVLEISSDKARRARMVIRGVAIVREIAEESEQTSPKAQAATFYGRRHAAHRRSKRSQKPSMELHSREALAPVFADLNQYDATMHFIGQSTILSLTADQATVEVYCLAHHVTVDGAKRRLMVAALRYHDACAKINGAWLFAERVLYVDWQEERALA